MAIAPPDRTLFVSRALLVAVFTAEGPPRDRGDQVVVALVSDVARAVDHYQRLGFATEYVDNSDPFALRNNMTIHLAHIDTSDRSETSPTIFCMWMMSIHRRESVAKSGMAVDGPTDPDYGIREAWHVDPTATSSGRIHRIALRRTTRHNCLIGVFLGH